MDKLQKLREERTAALEAAKGIVETVKADETRDTLTDDEQKAFDGHKAKVDELKIQIDELTETRAKAVVEATQRDTWLEGAEADQRTPEPRAVPPIRPEQPEQQLRSPSNSAIPVYCGELRAFRGVDASGMRADERAYRSGQWILANTLSVLPIDQGRVQRARQFCHDYGVRSPGVMEPEQRTTMVEGQNILGGALVPPELEMDLIKNVLEYGVFGRYVRRVPMARDTQIIPRYSSGLTAYAIGEGVEIDESSAAWDTVMLVAKKWGVLTKHSSELAEDSAINIADELTAYAARAIAQKQDDCGFKGDGTSTYHGIYGIQVKIDDGEHTAGIQDAASGSLAFADFTFATEFEPVMGKLPDFPGIQPAWFISKPGYYASMKRLLDAVGGVQPSDIVAGMPTAFMGYPVAFTSSMPTVLTDVASTVDILLADLRMSSVLGERRGISLQVSTERYFEYDIIGIKVTTRFDIVNHSLGDTSNAGPAVAIATPAS